MDIRIIIPPINKLNVNSSIWKAIDKTLATTADKGTKTETVTASIDFIDHALATQHTAVQITPKKTTSKTGNQSNE